MTKKNKKKIILIALIICLAALMTVVAFLGIETEKANKKQQQEEIEQKYIEESEEFHASFLEETILPRKIYELYKYEGNYDNEYLFKNMKVFKEYLDYLQKNVNSDNSEEFFEKNSEEIKSIIGLTSYEEFQEFINKIQNYNLKSEDFKYAEIEAGSSYTENNYFIFNIDFYYGEDEEKVSFVVSFAERSSLSIKVKYNFKSDEV